MKTLDIKTLYIDMDGTLTEWRPAATEEEMDQPGYFYSLKPHGLVVKAARILIAAGIDVKILSAFRTETAKQDKIRWLKRYLPELKRSDCYFNKNGSSKAAHLAAHGIHLTHKSVLLDDYTKNLKDWMAAGGTAVKLINPGTNDLSGTWKGYRVNRFDRPVELASALMFILENAKGETDETETEELQVEAA